MLDSLPVTNSIMSKLLGLTTGFFHFCHILNFCVNSISSFSSTYMGDLDGCNRRDNIYGAIVMAQLLQKFTRFI